MTEFCVNTRSRALIAYWRYGDIAGTWYSRPDPFYLRQPGVPREEPFAAVGSTAISDPAPKNNRGRFNLYCRQQGTWPKEVAGRDPDTDRHWFKRCCPVPNVTREYAPTMLVHGTADTDVPYEHSKLMAETLRRAGVEHHLVTVAEGEHGIGNIAAEEQDRIYRDAAVFLSKRV
jgi:dipeptidyl aminopeptidase/acylaminoacyl peptidase